MIRRGADQVVGIDNSAQQLQTAKRLATQHGLASKLTLVHGNAETIDAEDGAFDFALSEYGAVTWCDPYVWVKEAHRVLKPGGNLVILGNHPLLQVCLSPDGELAEEQLHRPYFGLYKLDWSGVAADPGGVEFGLPFGKWVALFIETGFEIEGFIEPKIPNDASGIQFCATAEWSRDYPPECVWKLRKRD
jgi:SAM-dependent methyltransferase